MPRIDILSPEDLEKNHQPEYPAYTLAQWREAVVAGHTIDGYWTWVHNSLCDEVAEADAEEDMDVTQVTYSSKGTCTPITDNTSAGDIPADLRNRLYTIVAEQLDYSVGENGPEKYDEQCLGAKLLTLEEVSDRIKAEYLASGPRASDVDWAVGELMAHCGRLFETPEHARSFLMEETHENLEKPE